MQKQLTPKIETLLEKLASFQQSATDRIAVADGNSEQHHALKVSYWTFKLTLANKFRDIQPGPKFVDYHPDYLSKNASKLRSAIASGYWEVAYCDGPAHPHPLAALVQSSELPSVPVGHDGALFPPNWNAVFRAYHDFFGHYKNRLGFDTLSELRVAAITQADFAPSADHAFLSETVLQTAVYHVTGKYAEQKALYVPGEIQSVWAMIREAI
jgi:hypothetical protein